jgi:outer membrane protein assembly factor BamE
MYLLLFVFHKSVILRHSMHPFSASVTFISRTFIGLSLIAGLTACKTRPSISVPNAIKPYKSEVVQGNFISSEQVAALRVGMPRNQVRNILGTPLLADVFHTNRWDYVFTMERDGVRSKALSLTVYFNGETLSNWEGDAMPSETEFVNSLSSGRKVGKVPTLTASEKELAQFAERENTKTKTSSQIETSAPVGTEKNYPPLDSK